MTLTLEPFLTKSPYRNTTDMYSTYLRLTNYRDILLDYVIRNKLLNQYEKAKIMEEVNRIGTFCLVLKVQISLKFDVEV